MFALPLPPRASLERYKKLAKELVSAHESGGKEAIGNWAEQWVQRLAKLTGRKDAREMDLWADQVEDFAFNHLSENSLTRAQFVIARSHGFESWPKFAKHLEELAQKISPVSRFEAAADAIVNGDANTLKQLLSEEPQLVHTRSTREHGATLLHYVSANGVEDYRQKTPRNIVAVTEILLQAGAEVDATADMYGGGCTTLGLAATSVHPELAGVQEALLQKLLDYGARMEQPPIAGNKQSILVACLANGRSKAAAFLLSRGAQPDLIGAAGLGLLDMVKALQPRATAHQLQEGLLYACAHGHNSVIEFLIEKGVNPAAQDACRQSGLHWAVIGGHLETVELLLRHNAPLEEKNVYGGTVLGQALWSAAHGGDPDVYLPILDALVAAGAKIPERHMPVNAQIDAWMAQHGSRSEVKLQTMDLS
jgi:hypothetical protein